MCFSMWSILRNCIFWKNAKIIVRHQSYRVRGIDKWFLVWSGKYKSFKDVPNYVDHSVFERARSIMRIRIANLMIFATIVGFIGMAYSGKQAAARGENLTKQNLDWHKKLKEADEKKTK